MNFDSPQAVFDHVVTSLVKQGQPSMRNSSSKGGLICVYRGDAGRKCAAGWCIEDYEYSAFMEGDRIRSLIGMPDVPNHGKYVRLARLYPYALLLDDLQRAHDEPALNKHGPWLEAFVEKARKVADRHSLRMNALDAVVSATV